MSINLAEHELAGQCREPTGARTPSASGPPNLGRRGRNAQSRTPQSFGFDPIEGLATGSVSWLDAQTPFDPGNGGESQGFRVFGCNDLISLDRPPRPMKGSEPLAGIDPSFDRSMILFHNVVQVRAGTTATPTTKFALLL